LAYSTQYTATVTTGAQSSSGTALAANYTWTFTTAAVPVPPTVTAVTPASAATGVAIGTTVTATFSQAMNSSTITSSTFTLAGPGGAAVSGTVTYAATGSVATFTPSANLAYSTQYTATITTGAQDSAGTALAANYIWTFTTAAAAPTVTAVTPASAATGVAVSTTVTATFSEAMNSSTITASTFTLTPAGGAAVTGTVSYSNSVATFTPSANLAGSTLYTATITTGAQNSSGTALAASYSWTFTTAAALAPTVTVVTPASAATGVAASTTVTAAFSEAMNASTITSSTFTLTAAGGAAVTGTVNYSNFVATFTPSANLAYSTQYTATITTGVQNTAGTALAANYTWTFTTSPVPPKVTAVTPASAATGVAVSTTLTATFSQSMNASTINSSNFTLTATGGASVTGTVTFVSSTSVATFTPSASLAFNTQYTATITTGVTNAAGTPLAANYSWSFTTAASNPNVATVDFTDTLQTIRGFGGSTAWQGPMTTQQATALYSPTSGLGLSILRLRIGPTGSPNTANPYETGEWDYEAANGGLAVQNNPKAIVFASPWTAPASMKTSSTSEPYYSGTCSPAAGYCGGYLDPSKYAAYAAYLEDFVTFYNSQNSVPLYAISMQNEPDYPNVNYESSYWTPQQMDTWVAGNASVITANTTTPGTKFMMPESFQFRPAQALTALDDPNAEALISIIGGHIYGVSPAPYSIPAGDSPKELWMTEHYLNSAGNITDALDTAQEVHECMVTGSYNAYVWWGMLGASTSVGNPGLIDSTSTPTKFGYAIGQFSKFILPGYTRVGVTDSTGESSNVLVSAYTGTVSGDQHYVIVAINMGTTAVSQSFTLQNGTVTSMTPYQTTSAGGLAPQTAITVTGDAFTYTLPAQSITTFVQ
jgi:O-glycosyl hydrolase